MTTQGNASEFNGSNKDEMIDITKVVKLRPLGVQEFELMSMDDIEERSKYIPIRLSLVYFFLTYFSKKERKRLRLIEAALNVSEYTDKVDILKWDKTKRIHAQLRGNTPFELKTRYLRNSQWISGCK